MRSAACSSSSDAADTTRPAGPAAPTKPASAEVKGHIDIETDEPWSGGPEMGEPRSGEPEMGEQDGAGPAKCATSAADIPDECALDLSFSESTDGEPGPVAPDASEAGADLPSMVP
ncbi:hypothetical protein [Streptomyces silvensis]|uniref:hypothetical protein n=1 Tax=Streptomyces silvensis TaxID=1765722 RepID=UPI0007C7B6CE|nr:hypothetical protein [Streptomyces silvensis]